MEEPRIVRFGEGKQGQQYEQALVVVAMAELKAAKEKGRSYFDQVPSEYRRNVRSLAEKNFPFLC